MKNVILTHKELQLNLFHAVSFVLDIIIKKMSKSFILTYPHSDNGFVWEVYHTDTRNSHLIYSFKIDREEYQMNDLRLGVTIGYLREQAIIFLDKFSNSNLPKSNEGNEDLNQEDNDLYDFANRALQNASAIASNKAGETINFGVTMADVKKWRDEFRPHYAPEGKKQ